MHDGAPLEDAKSAKSRRSCPARPVLYGSARRGEGLPPPWASRGAFFFVAAVALGCARTTPPSKPTSSGAPPEREGGPWASALHRDHPLVGRIWANGAFVARGDLEARAAAASFVLLGEKHDNEDHHRLQRALIESLVARGRAPSVAFEMLDVDAQTKVDAAQGSTTDADAFAAAVGWDARWTWSHYRPIVALALDRKLPIVAANFPRSRMKPLFVGEAIDDATRAELDVDFALPGRSALEEELVASHCGKLPNEALPAFVMAQRLRDAQMAERLVARATAGGAVLVTGSGHARNDRGVPIYLARRRPTAKTFTVAFVEVDPQRSAPEAYAERFHATSLPFDAVWFTPAVHEGDPCAKHP